MVKSANQNKYNQAGEVLGGNEDAEERESPHASTFSAKILAKIALLPSNLNMEWTHHIGSLRVFNPLPVPNGIQNVRIVFHIRTMVDAWIDAPD